MLFATRQVVAFRAGWRWYAVLVVAALACDAPVIARSMPGKAMPISKVAFDPHALELLQQMAVAYAHLNTLDQKTEFFAPAAPESADDMDDVPIPSATGTILPPKREPKPLLDEKLPRELHLSVARPNRLHLTVTEPDDNGGPSKVSEWISDGKRFWTYTSDTRGYTQEKAPGTLSAFARLPHMTSGSLELLMILGVNPFTGIEKQATTIACAGTATVRDTPTDVVLLTSIAGPSTTEVRLFLGTSDRLLRRVVVDTVQQPIQVSQPGKAGDALDELVDGVPPPPVPQVPLQPFKSHLAYENIIKFSEPNPTDFFFQIPKDAMLHADFDSETGRINGLTQQEYIQQLREQWGKAARKTKKQKAKRPHVIN